MRPYHSHHFNPSHPCLPYLALLNQQQAQMCLRKWMTPLCRYTILFPPNPLQSHRCDTLAVILLTNVCSSSVQDGDEDADAVAADQPTLSALQNAQLDTDELIKELSAYQRDAHMDDRIAHEYTRPRPATDTSLSRPRSRTAPSAPPPLPGNEDPSDAQSRLSPLSMFGGNDWPDLCFGRPCSDCKGYVLSIDWADHRPHSF